MHARITLENLPLIARLVMGQYRDSMGASNALWLQRRLDAGEDVQLIDVREPYEYQIAQIGGKLIPQNEVPQRLAEIDRDREVVVHCKSGGRSQRIAEFLVQSGYPRVVNVAGGILAWSDEIDPKVQKY